MRKQAMLNSVKDSIVTAIMFAIAFGVIQYAEQNRIEDWLLYTGWGVFALAGLFMVNFLAALGATTLMGGSYSAKKSELSIRVAIFNSDKHSSALKMIKVAFFYFIGAAVYPIALIVTLINLKDLFAKNESYEAVTSIENAKNDAIDAFDETVKTPDKKWKISNGPLSHYYFHSQKEALEFSIVNKIDASPEKLF
ncbi:hypothetical protein [Amphritea sp.]|uniref:hypothetical protein n=1 Tax=Amphritea sp. TaxID=1872502 RepID=UPI0025B9BB7A|nr:hypothetical protein [Amphritea sp.]